MQNDSETARADALFGLAQAEPDLFRAQLQSWLDEGEVALIDTLARRAEWWQKRVADWGHLVVEFEPPEWARIAFARMLLVWGEKTALARAAALLAPELRDRRGNLLEHLREMHERLHDDAIRELVARHMRDEEQASEGRVGGLAVSTEGARGFGQVSLTAEAEVDGLGAESRVDVVEEVGVEVIR